MPDQAPYLWQRGIAQYYAGRFRECRAQFESHRTVNADDVENAAWHFLCVARAESLAAARAALLPVGPDPRVPMREIYQMFRGDLSPGQVMAAAGTRPEGQFYAHLYVALYAEAAGDRARTLEHLKSAADEPLRQRWRIYAHGGSCPPGDARRDPIKTGLSLRRPPAAILQRAPAAIPSRGHVTPRRGISVSSHRHLRGFGGQAARGVLPSPRLRRGRASLERQSRERRLGAPAPVLI